MFESVAAAIEGMEVPADRSSLEQALQVRDRFEAKLAVAVAAFDRSGEWELDHASSVTAWLRHHGGLSSGDAAALARIGRRVGGAPALGAAWLDGRLTGGQVRAVVANVSDRLAGLFASHADEVVPALEGLSVRATAVAMQSWRARAEALLDGPSGEGGDTERALFVSRTLAGRTEVSGSFDAAAGEVIATALRVATADDDEATGERTPSERRADALADVCRFFLDHQQSASTVGRHRPHVNVVATVDDLGVATTLDGTRLDADAVQVLLCDSNVHRVLTDGRSSILDYGRSTRTAPPPLFTAVALRDGHCRVVEGCDRGPAWCDAHHVVAWEDGGPTCLDNLVLACSRHHHLVHRRRWIQRLDSDGTYTITCADGRGWRTRPAGPAAAPTHPTLAIAS